MHFSLTPKIYVYIWEPPLLLRLICFKWVLILLFHTVVNHPWYLSPWWCQQSRALYSCCDRRRLPGQLSYPSGNSVPAKTEEQGSAYWHHQTEALQIIRISLQVISTIATMPHILEERMRGKQGTQSSVQLYYAMDCANPCLELDAGSKNSQTGKP